MKILYLITGLGGGGAEKVVVDLADQFFEKGHTVTIAYLTGDIIIRPKNKNILIYKLGLDNFTNIICAYKNYNKLIEDFKPDVVHSHMVHANIFSRICRIFINVPYLICTAHSKNEGGKLRMLAYRFTHGLANLTTNVSKDATQNFIKLKAVPDCDIKTVYNGVDLEKFRLIDLDRNNIRDDLKISYDIPLFLAIGRFHDAKDYPNLIEAFSIICNKMNFIPILLIAGDGNLQSDIESLINYKGLQKNIFLLGRREDIVQLIVSSDFFVLSSKYEGLPTVVIEAMACETFVIATDCGGSKEILGETGILVPIENSEALAKGLEQAMSRTEDEIRENGRLARKRVEELFSLEASVDKWLKLYAAK